jgi:hypothetical protein
MLPLRFRLRGVFTGRLSLPRERRLIRSFGSPSRASARARGEDRNAEELLLRTLRGTRRHVIV